MHFQYIAIYDVQNVCITCLQCWQHIQINMLKKTKIQLVGMFLCKFLVSAGHDCHKHVRNMSETHVCCFSLEPRVYIYNIYRTSTCSVRNYWPQNLAIPQDPCVVYFPTWIVDFYGFHVGKYTVRPMDPMGYNYQISCSSQSIGKFMENV